MAEKSLIGSSPSLSTPATLCHGYSIISSRIEFGHVGDVCLDVDDGDRRLDAAAQTGTYSVARRIDVDADAGRHSDRCFCGVVTLVGSSEWPRRIFTTRQASAFRLHEGKECFGGTPISSRSCCRLLNRQRTSSTRYRASRSGSAIVPGHLVGKQVMGKQASRAARTGIAISRHGLAEEKNRREVPDVLDVPASVRRSHCRCNCDL